MSILGLYYLHHICPRVRLCPSMLADKNVPACNTRRNKMKLTHWYSGDQKPIRVGVYERDCGKLFPPQYSWFNGKTWSVNLPSPEMCSALDVESLFQNIPWIGVAK